MKKAAKKQVKVIKKIKKAEVKKPSLRAVKKIVKPVKKTKAVAVKKVVKKINVKKIVPNKSQKISKKVETKKPVAKKAAAIVASKKEIAPKPVLKGKQAPLKISEQKKIAEQKKKPIKKEQQEEVVEKVDIIAELIARGKQRGFVTEDEIIHLIPEVEEELDELENLYEQLETAGVKVVISDDMLKIETDREVEAYEKSKKDKNVDMILSEGIEDSSSDLVQMYLREIGRVPLLKSEEEVRLAKATEKGDLAAKQKLTEANLRLVVSIAKK
ncbi:MAG: RNA polymerase sigma factor, partial [Candidatus Moranbacteria bacterium GW2011_GWD2_38_7]